MASKGAGHSKPHAVCIPFPLQGHVKGMLPFAKLLYHKGFHITFVNTELNHKRLLSSQGSQSLNSFPHFTFETIPNPTAQGDPTSLDLSNLLSQFLDLLSNLNDPSNVRVPPITCIVSDACLNISITAAQNLGVPLVTFWPSSASASMGFLQLRALRNKGLTPLKDESCLTNGYLDTVVDWFPGMKDVRLRDFPSVIRTTMPNDPVLDSTIEIMDIASKGSAMVIMTIEALEQDVLAALSSMLPNVYSVAPLPQLLDSISSDIPLKSLGCNLCKEETECLQWLNTKERNSVLYVNFGSTTVLKPEKLIEFAWGFANSKHYFLWSIRPDAVLPPEFIEETKERCFIAGWCPQVEVLKHPSVGGFLTHCGWNSIIESLCAGVPLLCWPFFADHPMNCRRTCRELEIGLEIDSEVKRKEVEELVRDLMEGEKGKKIKSKVMYWKKKAEEAAKPGGSSSMNINRLISEVILPK